MLMFHEPFLVLVFLNKCDLLDKKLKSGVSVKKYIPRYGDRENTMPIFGRCESWNNLSASYTRFSHCL